MGSQDLGQHGLQGFEHILNCAAMGRESSLACHDSLTKGKSSLLCLYRFRWLHMLTITCLQ